MRKYFTENTGRYQKESTKYEYSSGSLHFYMVSRARTHPIMNPNLNFSGLPKCRVFYPREVVFITQAV
jgi:hypothetical protein